MFLSVSKFLLLFLLWIPSDCRLQEHRQFQYNTQVDGRGTYNFAYDTSHQPYDAHSLHMEYRDANGIVRGRYGYTDPRGNLRIVEYEAGPEGFKARGDVGPDMFPHMEAPGLSPQKPDPAPTPLRMAGWDPATNPINERVVTEDDSNSSYSPEVSKPRRDYIVYYDRNRNYRRRPSYPVVSQTVDPDAEVFQQELRTNNEKSKPLRSEPLTIYNIDVDPDEIRVAGPPASVRSRSVITSSAPAYQGREIITTSPEITYHEHSPRRRINRYYSYPQQRVAYYPYGQRIQRQYQTRYRPQSHYHGQQYHYD